MKRRPDVSPVFLLSIVVSILLAAVTWLLGGRLSEVPHLPDKGASWYFWQLPQPELASRLSAWIGYALHQVFILIVVLRARKSAAEKSGRAGTLNLIALGGNLVFILLHLLQTHIWYDGLAQDMPIWTSQGSVIVMLVLMLVMLTPRRGFFLGLKPGIPEGGMKFLYEFHGIYISWALTYTFWFHPMEGSYGLLSGFLYMFLLFIQLSMFGTGIHLNMKWLVLLETMVAVHGTLITVQKDNPIWPMFLSGFLFMFAFTYIFGLTKKRWIRLSVIAAYICAVILMYYFRGFDRLYEVSFIPVSLYGGGAALILLMRLIGGIRKRRLGQV